MVGVGGWLDGWIACQPAQPKVWAKKKRFGFSGKNQVFHWKNKGFSRISLDFWRISLISWGFPSNLANQVFYWKNNENQWRFLKNLCFFNEKPGFCPKTQILFFWQDSLAGDLASGLLACISKGFLKDFLYFLKGFPLDLQRISKGCPLDS